MASMALVSPFPLSGFHVSTNPSHYVARIAWLVPALLLFLTVNQAKVAADLHRTWTEGTPATAEVLTFENSDRVDVTYGYVSLRVPLPDGGVLVKDKLSLPHTLLPRIEGESTLAVRVRPGASQELVIDTLMPAHWLIAAAQSGMGLIGALLFGTLIFWWNRSLRREEGRGSESRVPGSELSERGTGVEHP